MGDKDPGKTPSEEDGLGEPIKRVYETKILILDSLAEFVDVNAFKGSLLRR